MTDNHMIINFHMNNHSVSCIQVFMMPIAVHVLSFWFQFLYCQYNFRSMLALCYQRQQLAPVNADLYNYGTCEHRLSCEWSIRI